MSCLQLEDVLEHRERPRYVPEREIKIERLPVHFPRYPWMFQQRFDFRCKDEELFSRIVIDGLYTKPVPYQKKPLPAAIPDRKREHSAKIAHAVIAILLVRVNDC